MIMELRVEDQMDRMIEETVAQVGNICTGADVDFVQNNDFLRRKIETLELEINETRQAQKWKTMLQALSRWKEVWQYVKTQRNM